MALTQAQIEKIRREALAAGIDDQKIANSLAGFVQDSPQVDQSGATGTSGGSGGGMATDTAQQNAGENTGGGNLVSSFFKTLFSATDRFGEGLGNAVDTVVNADANEQVAEQNKQTSDGYLDLARQALAKGDKAGAKSLMDKALEITGRNQDRAQERIDQATKGTEDVIKGGIGTAANFLPGGSTASARVLSGAAQGALSGVGTSESGGELAGATEGLLAGAATSGAMEVVGAGVSKLAGSGRSTSNRVMNKILNPFASQYDEEIVKLAQEKGVDLPASAKTSSNAVKQLEAIAQKSFFGGKITNRINAAKAQVDELAQSLTDEVVKPQDKKAVGDIVKKSFGDFENMFNRTKSDLYAQIPDEVNAAAAVTESTQDILNKIKERRGKSAVPNQTGFFDELAENLFATEGNTNTFQTLKQTRTDILKKLENFNDPVATGNKADLKALAAALSDDIEETVRAVDPNAYEVLQQANTYYREGLEKINSSVGKQIKNADPEKLVDTLIKPNSETDIALVKSVLDPDAQAALKDGFITKIMNDSVNAKSQVLDAQKLRTQIKKYGESSIKELIGEEGFGGIQTVLNNADDIKKLQQAISRGVKPAEGSQTAFLVNTLMSGGLFTISPGALAAKLVGEYALTKALTSDAVEKMLTEGLGEVAQKGGVQIKGSIPDIARGLASIYAANVATSDAPIGQVQAAGSNDETTVPTEDMPGNSPLDPKSELQKSGVDTTGGLADGTKPDELAPETPAADALKPFGGKSKNELLQLALAQGAASGKMVSLKDLKEISDIYDMIVPVDNVNDVDKLLVKRKGLADAGFSTATLDKQLEEMGYSRGDGASTEKSEAQKKFGPAVTRALTQLEKVSKIGTDDTIFRGGSTSIGKMVKNPGISFNKATNANFAEQATQYNSSLNLVIGAINQMLGAGTLNEGEASRLLENLPNEFTSEADAKAWFDNTRQILGVE